MRKFGLIVEVMLLYPDHLYYFWKFFVHFEQNCSLILKNHLESMAMTIHMMNRIREESDEIELSDEE